MPINVMCCVRKSFNSEALNVFNVQSLRHSFKYRRMLRRSVSDNACTSNFLFVRNTHLFKVMTCRIFNAFNSFSVRVLDFFNCASMIDFLLA